MSLVVLWNLIPANLRNIVYGAAVLVIAALAFSIQSARIDSLKARLAASEGSVTSMEKAYTNATASLSRAYAAANEATAKYHKTQVQTIKTVTVYKEKIVHVYEKDPAVRVLLDMPLPLDLLDGMCVSFPGSCDYSMPAPAKAAAGVDGAASAAAPAPSCSMEARSNEGPAEPVEPGLYNPGRKSPSRGIVVRDLVDNRAELLAWAEDARARHAGLVEFLEKTAE